jgi:hypothetical protein
MNRRLARRDRLAPRTEVSVKAKTKLKAGMEIIHGSPNQDTRVRVAGGGTG